MAAGTNSRSRVAGSGGHGSPQQTGDVALLILIDRQQKEMPLNE